MKGIIAFTIYFIDELSPLVPLSKVTFVAYSEYRTIYGFLKNLFTINCARVILLSFLYDVHLNKKKQLAEKCTELECTNYLSTRSFQLCIFLAAVRKAKQHTEPVQRAKRQ